MPLHPISYALSRARSSSSSISAVPTGDNLHTMSNENQGRAGQGVITHMNKTLNKKNFEGKTLEKYGKKQWHSLHKCEKRYIIFAN
jgi:hypothetical protein